MTKDNEKSGQSGSRDHAGGGPAGSPNEKGDRASAGNPSGDRKDKAENANRSTAGQPEARTRTASGQAAGQAASSASSKDQRKAEKSGSDPRADKSGSAGRGQRGTDGQKADAASAPKTKEPQEKPRKNQSRQQPSAAPAATGSKPGGPGGGERRGATARRGGGGKGGMALAVIALLVALVAIGIACWLWANGHSRLAQISNRLDQVESGMQSNLQNSVMPQLSSLHQKVRSLSTRMQHQAKSTAQFKSQIKHQLQAVQSRNARLANQMEGSSRYWHLKRVESLLAAANHRLQLYNDTTGAKQALTIANRQLGRMGDPHLHDIRAKIADEISSLQALPNPDIEGMSLTLAAQIKQVPGLPLASDVPNEYRKSQKKSRKSAAENETSASGWHHFLDSIGRALSNMVTIRRGNGTEPALLPPHQSFFLSQNLQLQLRTARLALLEHNTKSYRDSLNTAEEWLKNYYDTSDSRVSGMLDQLQSLSQPKLDWQTPDISASLTALRNLLSKRDSGNSGAHGESDSGNQPGDNTANEQSGAGETSGSSNGEGGL